MITFHPHDLHSSFGIGKFTNVTEEVPMFFLEPAEIQVAENIPQQDEPVKGDGSQRTQRCFGTADLRTQVQVR